MARSRSKRRGRRFSRVVVPVLVGGCLVIAAYFLLPDAAPTAAEAAGDPPAVSPGAATTRPAHPGLVAVDEPPEPPADKPAPIRQPTTKPAGDASARKADQPAIARNQPGDAQPAAASEPGVQPATKPTLSGASAAATFIAQAITLEDADKHFEARKVLNDALQSGQLDHATAENVKARIRDLNQTIIFTPTRRYAEDPQQSAYTVEPGDVLVKICRDIAVPPGFIARVNAVKPERIRAGQSLKLIQGPIHAVVSKKHFSMDLYLGALPGNPGSMYLMTFPVGLGEAGSTPTGTWEVTKGSKTENPMWKNPRTNESFEGDDPKNPLGERWIGLTGIAGKAVGAVSYGIHGTIEPESIGKNASMGCIRLKHEDVIQLFDMLSEGRSTLLVEE